MGEQAKPGAAGVIDALDTQYRAVLRMLRQAVSTCPEDLWLAEDEGPPYWREAYHAVFWMDNFLGDTTKQLTKTPFGIDVDPRLFTRLPNPVSREQVGEFIDHVEGRCSEFFGDLTLEALSEPNQLDVRDNVGTMILYSMRHGQHHVGRLGVALKANGIEAPGWAG